MVFPRRLLAIVIHPFLPLSHLGSRLLFSIQSNLCRAPHTLENITIQLGVSIHFSCTLIEGREDSYHENRHLAGRGVCGLVVGLVVSCEAIPCFPSHQEKMHNTIPNLQQCFNSRCELPVSRIGQQEILLPLWMNDTFSLCSWVCFLFQGVSYEFSFFRDWAIGYAVARYIFLCLYWLGLLSLPCYISPY